MGIIFQEYPLAAITIITDTVMIITSGMTTVTADMMDMTATGITDGTGNATVMDMVAVITTDRTDRVSVILAAFRRHPSDADRPFSPGHRLA